MTIYMGNMTIYVVMVGTIYMVMVGGVKGFTRRTGPRPPFEAIPWRI
jgi:hypothetical protein